MGQINTNKFTVYPSICDISMSLSPSPSPGVCVCVYVSMYLCIYVSMYLCIYVSMYVGMSQELCPLNLM